MLQPDTVLKDAEDVEKLPKWRNHMFDKNGKTYRGINLWDTRERAEDQMQTVFAESEKLKAEGKRPYTDTMDGMLMCDDYLWHMQLPVMEE